MPKEAVAFFKSLARKHTTFLEWERLVTTETSDLVGKNAAAVKELVRFL